MDAEIKQWMLAQIDEAAKRRDWEAMAVTRVFMQIKRATRIAASKATSFADLRAAITGKECGK